MKYDNLGFMFQPVGWSFREEIEINYENSLKFHEGRLPNLRHDFFKDINLVLDILFKYELLIPTYARANSTSVGEYPVSHFSAVEFDDQSIFKKFKIDLENFIKGFGKGFPGLDIDGYGVVINPDSKIVTRNLVQVSGFSSFQRSFEIFTYKSVWTPLRIDDTYEEDWQLEVFEKNAPRLTAALQEIKDCLGLFVSPAENEVNWDGMSIWTRGFNLFPSPDVARKVALENPPPPGFDLEKYLKPLSDEGLEFL